MDTALRPLAAPHGAPARSLPPRRPRRGFTIIEVMMATFVMALGISSSILVMKVGFQSLDTARKTTLAAQIMQSEMERIRMLSWDKIEDLAAQTATNPKVDLGNIFPQNTAVEREMFRQISDTFTPIRSMRLLSDKDNEIYEITVEITWTGLDGVAHRRTSSTQYCKDGLYAYYYRVPSI